MLRHWLATFALAVTSTVGAFADVESEAAKFAALPQGVSLIPDTGIEAFKLIGDEVSSTVITVKDQSFARAAHLITRKRPDKPYNFQFLGQTTAPVKKGDKLLVVFEARAVAPLPEKAVAQSALVFELAGPPYTKSTDYPFKLTTSWQRYYVPFEAALDLPAGKGNISFRLGFDPQTIEIGGLKVLDFGPDFPREKLPYTPVTYVGREPDAVWRVEAAQRIERLRKGDLTVTVVDVAGKPVSGTKVKVEMTRHAFAWGSAVDAKILLDPSPDNDRYREHILRNYNRVVLENDLKWSSWSNDPQRALQAVDWLRDHGLEVRGHVLVWPGEKNLPSWIDALMDKPEALKAAIIAHIHEEAGVLRDQLVEWDVVNEAFTNFRVQAAMTGLAPKSSPDWIERHAEVLADFYRAAREADPKVKLDINDYSILATGGEDYPHQEHYERTIRQLLAVKAPVEGIGMQGHFNEDLTPITRLWEILDRFGKLGLPIQVTEFDINTLDEKLAGDYTRDFLTALFAHENVIGILTWGFWEKRHWIPQSALYRSDWSPRPAAEQWERLVKKEWWTTAEGVTDANGKLKVRGFLGQYKISSAADSIPATLAREGSGVTLKLSR